MRATESTKLRQRAEARVKVLWDFYNEKGILRLADFKRLTGGQYAAVMATFETYGLKSPPVYDSREEKYKRKAQLLTDEALRLGQDYLTIEQAAEVLGTKPARVIGIEGRLLRAGCSLPEIVMEEKSKDTPVSEDDNIFWRFHGICNPLYHPAGLPVLRWWEGPKPGEITYLLR